MTPHPGDPSIRSPDTPTKEEPMEAEDETDAIKHARRLESFSMEDLEVNNQELKNIVLHWKNVAERLRSAKVPLHVNRRARQDVDPALLEDVDALDQFLDELIPVEGVRKDLLAIKLRILISGAEDIFEFSKRMKELDFSLKCNEIWEHNSVAYRCNTCALTPCMSLCAECFLSNGHAGHDFTRFLSREGGACDCGNVDVLNAAGFCERHGPAAMAVQRDMPPVALAEYIYMKLITRLFIFLRGFVKRYHSMQQPSYSILIQTLNKEIGQTIAFIQECVDMGGPMRNAMTKILTDAELYKNLNEDTGDDYQEQEKNSIVLFNLDWRTRRMFETDLVSLIDDSLTDAFPVMKDQKEYMKCETLLHEFLFWILRLHFPQNAINFILSMLSDPDYLNLMALRFFKWYPLSANIMKTLCTSVTDINQSITQNEVGQVASRIIHVSVQMLSSSALCTRMDKECDLVSLVFRSALYLLGESNGVSECFLDSNFSRIRHIQELPKEVHQLIRSRVILAEKNSVIQNHGYWFVMGDIQNVMSHTQLAVMTVVSPAFQSYLKIATLMQGMNVYWRIVSGDHAPHDNGDHAQRTFTMEYETLSITMFNFVMAILSENNADAAKTFFCNSLHALREWIKDMIHLPEEEDNIPKVDVKSCPAYNFSIHLPLHRHLSTAISHFTGLEGFEDLIYALREEEPFLRLALLHPMRIHAFRAEHHCGMWVRNGHQLRIQSMLYAQPHINASFFQPDLDLIRFCAANIKGEWFITSLMETFHLDEVFEIEEFREDGSQPSKPRDEDDVPGRYSPDPSGTRHGTISQRNYNVLSSKKQLSEAEKELRKAMEEEGVVIPEDLGLEGLKILVDKTMAMNERQKQGEEIPVMWKGLYEKLTEVGAKLRSNSKLMKLVMALHHCQSKQDRIIKNDWSKIAKEPGGTVLSVNWSSHQESFGELIVRRVEWIDPLVQNCLLLLAEILVIRMNCGATERESMRMEMVHELANGKMKHSHIRQCITDKGNRITTNTDFTEILNEIADYHEPDEGNGGYLQQGGYTLKKELWQSDFCPVFAQMRAPLPGKAQESMLRAEKIDLEKIPVAQRPSSLWIPYRLYEPALTRHEATENIFKILFTDKFTQLALLVLETRRNGINFLSENTFQLMIYLISMAAHEGGNKGEPERVAIYARFTRIYRIQMCGKKDQPYDISLLQSIFTIFMSLLIKKGIILEMLEKVLSRALYEERIVGGEIEYIARLLTILATHDETCKFLVETEIRAQKEIKKEEECRIDKEMERKLLMRKKRESLMEKQRQKGAKLMEIHRENEGLSQDDVNAMDITTHQVTRYDCPICGENDIPSTLQNPLGMMGILVSNNIAELRVTDEWIEPSLMDAIEGKIDVPMRKKRWDAQQEQEINILNIGVYTDNIQGPSLTAEIQTCGHTAHLECFRLFHQSQADVLRHEPHRVQLLCPLCRTAVDVIIPMKIDADFGTSDVGSLKGKTDKTFQEIKNCILGWKKHYPDQLEDTNFNDHYGLRTDNWMDNMDPVNQYHRKKYDSQTNLVAIIRATVERNFMYRQMGVPERRKNAWTLPIVHLIPAAVFRTTTRNEDMCLAALRDLFVPDMVQIVRSISESALPVSFPHSPTEFDMDDALLILKDGPSRVAEIAQQGEGKFPTFAKKTGASSFLPSQKVENLLTSRSDVPLLLMDFRLLFVRISCFIVDNDKLSTQDKLALLETLAKRVVRAGGIRAAVILLYRVTPQLNQDLITNSKEESIAINDTALFLNYGCRWFYDSPHMWKALQNVLTTCELSYTSKSHVLETLEKNVKALDDFCKEFIFSTALVTTKEEISPNLDDLTDCRVVSRHWIRWFVMAMNTAAHPANNILHRIPLTWRAVSLLAPPKRYDDLFSKLFKKKCLSCDKVPATPFICMSCGKMVCFDDCCKIYRSDERAVSLEVNRHADECTGGSGVFLVLNSAVVVVVRGRMGAVWGSIYLDAHGEEDRNLRRGKQLFLSESRFRVLQNDWVAQNFERVQAWYFTNLLYNLVRVEYNFG